MKIASMTDKGRLRDSNQDSFAAGELVGGALWAVVCDGMGGSNGGSIASSRAVQYISDCIISGWKIGMSDNSVRAMLKSAVISANVHVFDISKSSEDLKGMGTTVVAAVVAGGVSHIAHAGDSRAYLFRGGELTQLTTDHSIVQSMVESGQLTAEEAKRHPKKNVITRAMGVDEDIDFDFNEVVLQSGDVLLLCTDGLTNYLDSGQIVEVLKTNTFEKCPEKLTELANSAGGGDNITVVTMLI